MEPLLELLERQFEPRVKMRTRAGLNSLALSLELKDSETQRALTTVLTRPLGLARRRIAGPRGRKVQPPSLEGLGLRSMAPLVELRVRVVPRWPGSVPHDEEGCVNGVMTTRRQLGQGMREVASMPARC